MANPMNGSGHSEGLGCSGYSKLRCRNSDYSNRKSSSKVDMTSAFRPFSLSRAGIVALVALFSQSAIPQQQQQNVPDAPSATRPATTQLPNVPPAASTAPDTQQQQPQANPAPP